MVELSAIVALDNPCGNSKTGSDYREAAAATGGVEFNLCAADWSPFLEQLGIRAAGLSRTFHL